MSQSDASSVRVLLVEHDAEDARTVTKALAEANTPAFRVSHVTRLEAAVRQLHAGDTDVVLLDLNLPDANPATCVKRLVDLDIDVPVVVWTEREDEELFIELMRNGAHDCVVKGQQEPGVLARTLRYAVERHRLATAAKPPASDEVAYDTLVGLPVRKVFNNWLQQAVDTAEETRQRFTLMLASLDRFRAIQDTLGQRVCDHLLRAATERLSSELSPRAMLVRLGGSDFGIILPQTTRHDEAAEIARRVIASLSQPYSVDGSDLYVGASIGIVIHSDRDEDATQMLHQADLAMQKAKEAGSNNYQFYSHRIREAEAHSLAMESALRQGLDRNELVLYYQPCIDLASGRVASVEALARWQHPELGLVTPGDFIALAERTGMIFQLDAWALRTACRQVRDWPAPDGAPVSMAVNLSTRHFERDGLVDLIADVLSSSGLAAARLELEITETALMGKPERAAAALARLKASGVKIAVDDFGVGFSSLNYLRRLPVDILKIDQSFIRELTVDPKGAAVVDSIISLAKTLGLTVVAEGVETRAQLRWLVEHGCDRVQGFLFSPGVPQPDVNEMSAVGRLKLRDVAAPHD